MSSELQQLMQTSIPSAREAQDKRKALEETMGFVTQSLASVAYQISNLASDILKMLDLQAADIRQVEANVCSITQVVEIHKEKVSRREIGSLTICKTFPHYQKIIYPEHLEPLEAYYRKPLNFSSLDEIGHGIKDQSTQLARTGTLSRRGTKTSAGQSSGSIGRSHRNLEPILPPVIPDDKLSSASSVSSLSNATESLVSPTTNTSPELPPPSMLPLFLPPSEGEDLLPPIQADILPPPPVADDNILPPPPDLDFPTPPSLPSLDTTNCEQLKPPLLPPPPPPEKLPWAPETYMEKVVTLYPYTQQNENELSFEEGTIIYVTRKYSDGWCEGVASGAAGLFPGNYVEPLH
ncbi:hypothetical protein JD844_001945 [Phrynosoma platyrhinos]|uniref:SH3 domain-containing protein n=1 Tax=Phrynosoma platyrhinos TaxID=52577 RepID=A0ABQ7TBF7_PHRPL|nr:hypothetical protein JD844_001945 [Phrynosoma platyrhinos]